MAEPLRGDLLLRVIKSLKARGFTEENRLKDARGMYAVFFKTSENFPFALVAKGSDVMGETVSVQKSLLTMWNGPLVMAWLPPGAATLLFYVFSPEECLRSRRYMEPHENFRFGSLMWNFSINLGKRWKPLEEPLEKVWAKVEAKSGERLDAYI